jgi:acyl-CoA synthetase (AMP-forming)/AMP-acid ligase II
VVPPDSTVVCVPHRAFGEDVTAVVVTTGKVALTETNVLKVLEQRLAKFKLSKLVLFAPRPAAQGAEEPPARDLQRSLQPLD